MASAILRQWLILTMLPLPPRRIDSGALEARLRERGIDVHRRTIQRDLIELSGVFPIISDDRAKPYGWRWTDDASFARSLPLPRADVTAASRELVVRLPRAALSHLVAQIGGRSRRVADDPDGTKDHAAVTVAVDDTGAARRRLFGHAHEIEVLAPRDLRAEIATMARRALALHTHERASR
ncbi:MAG: WYL domain-containing protein [Labilithrix sp.]|nr:WYL domain-containing protein [Labilithrix sp.]MCW5815781.1 WYL domain-containing protein [Labilithrix sp.]